MNERELTDREQLIPALKAKLPPLLRGHPVAVAYLYGSFAQGCPTPFSDIDIREEFAASLPHVRRRWLAQQKDWQHRQAEAWDAARPMADVLRSQFDAQAVIAFGSLVQQ